MVCVEWDHPIGGPLAGRGEMMAKGRKGGRLDEMREMRGKEAEEDMEGGERWKCVKGCLHDKSHDRDGFGPLGQMP